MRRFLAASTFLTCLPIPGAAHLNAADIGRSTPMFPIVGAMVNGLALIVGYAWLWWFPGQFGLAAGLITLTTVLLTGALHQDALADAIDGFGGGQTRDDVLRIMRDPSIGSFGATALIMSLGLRCIATWTLLTSSSGVAFVAAGASSRWVAVLLGWHLPYASSNASKRRLGRAITDYVRLREIGLATFTTSLVFCVTGMFGAGLWLVAFLSALGWAWVAHRRIRGVTGDVMGAAIDIAEVAALLLASAGFCR